MAVKLNPDYLSRIKGIIQLYTDKKTTNVLDGDFNSLFWGRSLEFDDLKEYTYGDNVADIDWKSSSRTGKILIRRYVATRKHNLLIVGDTGVKMRGHTDTGEVKSNVALMTFGTIAYLADKQGADFSLYFATGSGYRFDYFGNGMVHLESQISEYERHITDECNIGINDTLYRAVNQNNKKMIVLIITDLDGIARIDEKLIKYLTYNNDVKIMCIRDAKFTSENAFDLSSGKYVESFFFDQKKLSQMEDDYKKTLFDNAKRLCISNKVRLVDISNEEQIVPKVSELFARTDY